MYSVEPSSTPKFTVNVHSGPHDSAAPSVVVPITTDFPVLIRVFSYLCFLREILHLNLSLNFIMEKFMVCVC